MTVDHETDAGDPYEDGDIEGLPDYQDLGGGLSEYNTQYEGDVQEIIENAAEEGDRLSITVFDETNHLAYDLFDRGISADYLDDLMSENGWGVSEMIENFLGDKIDVEDIGFYQIHESPDSSDLAF